MIAGVKLAETHERLSYWKEKDAYLYMERSTGKYYWYKRLFSSPDGIYHDLEFIGPVQDGDFK